MSPVGWALPVFSIVVWLFATLGLSGQLGRSTDDYAFNISDPVTGLPPRWSEFDPWLGDFYFWRPIHIVMLTVVRTYLDDFDRGIHIGVAVMHGLASLLLFRVLQKASGSRLIAAWCALLFLTCPINHEVALWFCTTSTAIAACLYFWLCLRVIRWSRGPTTAASWRALLPMALIAAVIPCFYEQPGAAIGALPLLYLCTCDPNQPLRTRFGRAIGATAILTATQVVFVAAFLATTPPNLRGGSNSLIHLNELAERLATMKKMLAETTGPQFSDLIRGSWQIGHRQVVSTIQWVWLPAALLSAVAWLISVTRPCATPPSPPSASDRAPESADPPSRPHTSLRWPLLAAFGLGIIVLSLIPVAVIRGQGLAARIMYVPLIGFACVSAALLVPVRTAASRFRVTAVGRAVGTGMVAATAIGACICFLGIQSIYQRTAQLDARVAQRLAAMVGDVPSGAVFVPLRLSHTAGHTGIATVDRLRHGAFETYWSAAPVLQRTMHRFDIFVAGRNPWADPELDWPSGEHPRIISVGRAAESLPSHPLGGFEVPVERLIPFVVEANGQVRLVRQLVFSSEDGGQRIVNPDLVAALLLKGAVKDAATAVATLPSNQPIPNSAPLTGWTWLPSGSPTAASRAWIWGDSSHAREATWLHPTAEGGRRAAMQVQLPPSPHRRRVVLFATLANPEAKKGEDGPPIDLRVTVDGAAVIPAVRFDREQIRSTRCWVPVSIEIPPSDAPRTLGVRVAISGSGSSAGSAPIVWMSTGRIIDFDVQHAGPSSTGAVDTSNRR